MNRQNTALSHQEYVVCSRPPEVDNIYISKLIGEAQPADTWVITCKRTWLQYEVLQEYIH